MRRFWAAYVVALLSLGCFCFSGTENEESAEEETVEEFPDEDGAEQDQEVVDAEPIPDELYPGNWLGKHLTGADDLPDVCPEQWREQVDFRGYPHWECLALEQDTLMGALSDGQTVRFVLMAATEERENRLENCQEVELEKEPEPGQEIEPQGLDCDDFFAVKAGPMIMSSRSQDEFQEILEAGEAGPRMGERIELGDYAYVVENSRTESDLGPGFSRIEAGDGAAFIVIDYSIENLTNETQTALTGDFKLRDYQDREFQASSEAETALSMSDGSDFIVSELQPGLAREATTAFQVPEDVLEHPITLVIPEKGLMGNDEVELPFVLY